MLLKTVLNKVYNAGICNVKQSNETTWFLGFYL